MELKFHTKDHDKDKLLKTIAYPYLPCMTERKYCKLKIHGIPAKLTFWSS